MRITMACDYAVRTILYLAMKESAGSVTLNEISVEQDIPKSFLNKVIQKLISGGLVISRKGRSGGYSLACDPKDITLRNVLEASEGQINLSRCLISDGICKRDVYCSVHVVWAEIQRSFIKTLDSYNIEYLVGKLKKNMDRLENKMEIKLDKKQ
jgi:Rrf2 family protein